MPHFKMEVKVLVYNFKMRKILIFFIMLFVFFHVLCIVCTKLSVLLRRFFVIYFATCIAEVNRPAPAPYSRTYSATLTPQPLPNTLPKCLASENQPDTPPHPWLYAHSPNRRFAVSIRYFFDKFYKWLPDILDKQLTQIFLGNTEHL